MKKKLLIGSIAVIISLVAAFNINLTKINDDSGLSALSLANVEMLAKAAEIPEVTITCDATCYGRLAACWGLVLTYNPFNPFDCEWTGRQMDTCKC